jgi:hypothetical protein
MSYSRRPLKSKFCHFFTSGTLHYITRRLLLATPSSENPVDLLQAASRDHIPVNPSQKSSLTFFDQGKGKGRMIVPASMDRPTIDSVIEEIMQQEWYKDQIIDRRVFDEKEGTIGANHPWGNIWWKFCIIVWFI